MGRVLTYFIFIIWQCTWTSIHAQVAAGLMTVLKNYGSGEKVKRPSVKIIKKCVFRVYFILA
jgi:hypothetical protein